MNPFRSLSLVEEGNHFRWRHWEQTSSWPSRRRRPSHRHSDPSCSFLSYRYRGPYLHAPSTHLLGSQEKKEDRGWLENLQGPSSNGGLAKTEEEEGRGSKQWNGEEILEDLILAPL